MQNDISVTLQPIPATRYPMKLLLMFADSLEKQIFNAYSGSIHNQTPSMQSAPVRIFYYHY